MIKCRRLARLRRSPAIEINPSNFHYSIGRCLMKISLRVWLAALAACLSLFVAIYAGLGWRGFAQIKERKSPTPAPTPTPQPVRRPAPMKIIRPTPTPGPRPAPTPLPPPPTSLLSFPFETVTLDKRGIETSRQPGQARYFIVELGDGVTLEMVEIPGGSFVMGSPETEYYRSNNEGPQHRVDVPSFWMGKFEITQAQWKAVMGGDNNSQFKGDELPVENVLWAPAQSFLRALNRKLELQDKDRKYQYRLPSEAEWEYAARAGTTTPFAFGETITSQIVNFDGYYSYASAPRGYSRGKTVEVGGLGAANAFGLFDMHGNVWEWCEDVYHTEYDGAPADGSAWLSGGKPPFRTMRGGSCVEPGGSCRSATRITFPPGDDSIVVGFRVVVSAITLYSQSRR
jgi:eukaryotic-like serine/threonine-protein kinase